MRNRNKWVAFVLAAIFVVASMLAGCSKETPVPTEGSKSTVPATTEAPKATNGKEETSPTIDTSEHVELVCYFYGNPPTDIQKVEDKINEILEEKINASISFQFTTSTDAKNKYAMILTGGEKVDIIISATWLSYYSFIDKGAFLELSDLIDEYAPELRTAMASSFFEETLIDGKLYTIPNNYQEYTGNGILYREDLRKKYNLPIPDSRENIEAYMAGIKENEPSRWVLTPRCAAEVLNLDEPLAFEQAGLRVPYNDVHNIHEYWGTQEHIDNLKILKEWADLGYWPSDAISNTVDLTSLFTSGTTAMAIGGVNFNKYLSAISTMKDINPEWEIGYIPDSEITNVAFPAAPYHNGIAIPTVSENPERAMMAISLLYSDKELNNLLMYGIEGDHYTLDKNGYYVPADNNSGYKYEGSSSWNFRNVDVMLSRESDQQLLDYFAKMSEIASKTVTPYVNHSEGFNGTLKDTATQKAALDALSTEYITPLMYGMIDDIEGSIAEFMAKAEKAGLSDVQAEYIAKWNSYLESKGY